MTKWFHKPATGANADIARHQAKEKQLKETIAALDPNDKMDAAFLRTYEHLLDLLEQSKVEVVNKIGRKVK